MRLLRATIFKPTTILTFILGLFFLVAPGEVVAKNTYKQDYFRNNEIAFFKQHAELWLKSAKRNVDKNQTTSIDSLLSKRDKYSFDSELTEIALKQYSIDGTHHSALLSILLKNKLHGLANRVISQKPSAVVQDHLNLLLDVVQAQDFVPQSSIELAIRVYEQQLSSLNLPAQTTIRLASLAYKQKKSDLALALLRRIAKPSMAVHARKAYLEALIALDKKRTNFAMEKLKPLCITKADPITADAACLSYAKILASKNDFKNSRPMFLRVGADSPLYEDALFDLMWAQWRDESFDDAIELAQQWSRLFPNHGLTFEVDRLQALSLLQSKSYKQSIFTYRHIQHRLAYEKESVQELAVYALNNSFDFVREFRQRAIAMPITDRATEKLVSSSTFKNLIYLDAEIEVIETALDDLKQRINRINVYLKQYQPVDPKQASRIDRGLVLMKLLRRARQEFLPLGFQQPANDVLEKIVEAEIAIADTERRVGDIFEHLSMRPAYVFGMKRKSFSKLVDQAKRFDENAAKRKRSLQNTKAVFEGLLVGEQRQKLYQVAHNVPLKIDAVTTTTAADETINAINAQLRGLSTPTVLPEAPLRKQLAELSRNSKRIADRLSKFRSVFASVATKYFTNFLKVYERDLNELGRDLNWGLINAEHAYLSVLGQNQKEQTAGKYDVMQKFDALTKDSVTP